MRYLELSDADAEKVGPCEIMRILQGRADAAEVQRAVGGHDTVLSAEVLQRDVHGTSPHDTNASGSNPEGENTRRRAALARVQRVRRDALLAEAPRQQGQDGQQAGERRDVVCGVPCQGTLADGSTLVVCVSKRIGKRLRAMNRSALKGFGNAVCPQVAELVGAAVMRMIERTRTTP